jgi:hypothetical protein
MMASHARQWRTAPSPRPTTTIRTTPHVGHIGGGGAGARLVVVVRLMAPQPGVEHWLTAPTERIVLCRQRGQRCAGATCGRYAAGRRRARGQPATTGMRVR